MKTKTYPHLAARVFGSPLLIERGKLDIVLSALAPKLHIPAPVVMPSMPEDDDDEEEMDEYQLTDSGIAVIDICGTLVRRATGMDAMSGLCSYAEIEELVMNAATDPNCRGILLNVDSYGGEAGGCFDLASMIYQVRGIKPVWAIADQSAFSAGYALASAAEKLFVTQTSGVGSVGVIMLHLDQSAYDAKEGLKYSAIYAGSHKNDWSPHEPLSSDVKSDGQAEVDRLMDIFVTCIARNRGLTPQAIADTQAGLFWGDQAVKAGFADGVATFQQVLSDFSTRLSASGTSLRDILTSRLSNNSAAANVANSTQGVATPMALPETTPAPTPQPAAAQPVPSMTRADIEEISALCKLAGTPFAALDYISAGLTPAEVRTKLLAKQADIDAAAPINGNTVTNMSTGDQPAIDLVAMAKKRVESRKGRAA